MFEAYKIGVAISLTNSVSPALANIAKDFAKTEADAAIFEKRLKGITLGLTAGLMAVGAGVGLAAMFKTPIQDAMAFERAMLRIKNIGGMDAQTLGAVRSDALSGKYKGIGAAESVDLFRDLHAAFGDAADARKFMPMFAGMARVTQGTYGKSAVQGEEDVKALAKVAERRGGTKSPAAMESAMDLSMKIQNASGGAVTPKDLLAFMNRMGAMGNSMSNDGVLKMWALMQEQGGGKAGTSLNSALQNLVNGRGTEGAGFEMRKFGLVDYAKQKAYLQERWGDSWSKHINKISPDAIIDSQLARTDTVGWVQKDLIPRLDKRLDAMGIKDDAKRDMQKSAWISTMFSNRTGADAAALMATQIVRIMKDFRIAGDSAGLKESIKNYDSSPMAKFQDLEAKWNTSLVNLGVAALPVVIPMVDRLTNAISRFSAYAEKNPGTVSTVVKGILLLSASLIVLGGLSTIINGVRALHLAGQLFFSVVTGLPRVMSVVAAGGRLLGGVLLRSGTVLMWIVRGFSLLLTTLGTLAPYMAAFAAGWGIGTMLNKAFIEGTRFSNWLGHMIAVLISPFSSEAREALAADEKAHRPAPAPPTAMPHPQALFSAPPTSIVDRAQRSPPGALTTGKIPVVVAQALMPTQKPTATQPVAAAAPAVKYLPDAPAWPSQDSRPSMVPPAAPQMVQVNSQLNLDGKKVADSVTTHQARAASRPPAGGSSFDPTMGLTPVSYQGAF